MPSIAQSIPRPYPILPLFELKAFLFAFNVYEVTACEIWSNTPIKKRIRKYGIMYLQRAMPKTGNQLYILFFTAAAMFFSAYTDGDHWWLFQIATKQEIVT